ncbi:MAG: DsbE family thiol:disulfide interchange protein [Burkholderiaceae bacterium]|nr:DsbE family thiol:disulfide interchange protein [Burkholderiaceae bacterium]
MRSLRFLLPLAVFVLIAAFLYKGLSNDPRLIPSPLIDKPAPAFSLPRLDDATTTWGPEALRGKVWLLNVWGSWCAACELEHPLFNQLAARRFVPIVGLAWKDRPEASRRWLERLGNPYAVVVSDAAGKVAIDYGVYGAPETFVIDQQGRIRHKQTGPFTAEIVKNQLIPLVDRLRREAQ